VECRAEGDMDVEDVDEVRRMGGQSVVFGERIDRVRITSVAARAATTTYGSYATCCGAKCVDC